MSELETIAEQPSGAALGAAAATEVVLVDVLSGEMLLATVENAHRVLSAAREMKRRIQDVINATTDYLLEQSRVQGTKTLHAAAGDIVLSGGTSIEYDPEALVDCLREAGCPEERINEVVVAEVGEGVIFCRA